MKNIIITVNVWYHLSKISFNFDLRGSAARHLPGIGNRFGNRGVFDWIRVAQDRDQRRALRVTVMSLRVAYKSRNTLNFRVTLISQAAHLTLHIKISRFQQLISTQRQIRGKRLISSLQKFLNFDLRGSAARHLPGIGNRFGNRGVFDWIRVAQDRDQ